MERDIWISLAPFLYRRPGLLGIDVCFDCDEANPESGQCAVEVMVLRPVAQPGDTVVVESPCYFGILEILESLGIHVLLIPSSCESGIDIGLLADAIERHPVKAVVIVPTFSNPNGSCMSEDARRELLMLLSDYDLPLVEDDLYGELHFRGKRVRPVKAFDSEGRVLYCGSFSKCLSPGLRLGWIAVGRYAEQVKRLKFIRFGLIPRRSRRVCEI